jgi:hypothetical protein
MDKSIDEGLTAEDAALIGRCVNALEATILGDPRPMVNEALATKEVALQFVASDQWAQMVNDMARFINAGCTQPGYRREMRAMVSRIETSLVDMSTNTLDAEALRFVAEALEIHFRIHLLQYGRITEIQRYGAFSTPSKDELWEAMSSWNCGGPNLRNLPHSAKEAARLKDAFVRQIKSIQRASQDPDPGL